MQRAYRSILGLMLGVMGVLAAPVATAGHQFLYVGVMPVYASTNFNWKNTVNNQTLIDKANGVTQIGLFLGYGVLVDKIYLGVEGSTQLGHRNADSHTTDPATQASQSNSATMSDIYIVDFRPGYIFGDKNSMLYGIAGLNTANFSARQKDVSSMVTQDSGTTRENGLRLGAGYNLGLGRHFMARVEYVFTKFSAFEFSTTAPAGSVAQNWKFNPYSNEVNLGLSIIFNL
jgi:opacity protein-like surface antigen